MELTRVEIERQSKVNPSFCLSIQINIIWIYIFQDKNIQAQANVSPKVSTNRVEEARQEQIEVEVEEQTTAPDVSQLDQKVIKQTLARSFDRRYISCCLSIHIPNI